MLNILIIDDDPLTRRALYFEVERAGHKAEAAGDAYDGLRLIEFRNYDLIICDIILPQISGLVFSTLLKQFSCKSIPILLMSSAKEMQHIVSQQDFGALGFVQKPVKRHLLNNWLNQIEEMRGSS
ncbi:MAG: response regulator [Bacteroidia bacterium]